MSIYCIGRNYAEHARELGNEVPAEPVVFLKPSSCVELPRGVIELPQGIASVHHEVELVLRLASPTQIDAVAVGIDVTDRATQAKLKQAQLPWLLAKGRPTFAPLGNFIAPASSGELMLKVNGQIKQQGSTEQMIFSIPKLLEFLSSRFALAPGDLVFTGTPQGVGEMKAGDHIQAEFRSSSGASVLDLKVAAALR